MFEYTLRANEYAPVLGLPTLRRNYIISDPQLVKQVLNEENLNRFKSRHWRLIRSILRIKQQVIVTEQYTSLHKSHSNTELINILNEQESLLIANIHQYADHEVIFDAMAECQNIILKLLDHMYFHLGLADDSEALVRVYNKLRRNTMRALINIPNPATVEAKLLFYLRRTNWQRRIQKAYQANNSTSLTMTEIKKQLIYAAEFTATSLVWAIHFLIHYPEWQTILYDEIASQPLDDTIFNHSSMISMFLSETLRLYPPYWLLTRFTHQSYRLGEFQIPPRSYLSISAYALHRNIYYWPQPAIFNPYRFKNPGTIQPNTYLPFGQSCPHQNSALTQIKLALSVLVKKFTFHEAENHSFSLTGYFGLRPHPHYMARVCNRDS